MMYFYLVISLLSTFLFLNICFVEYVQSKLNPYKNKAQDEMERKATMLKLCLMTLMAFFWSAVIVNW